MGEYTPNDWFYKPSYGAQGQSEKDEFDAGLDAVDEELEDHKSRLENINRDTLSDLQAVSAGSTDYIWMLGRNSVGDSGTGLFVWDDSDLSSEVSDDEVNSGEGDGGIYVAPDSDKSGASGAWVRQIDDYISMDWYGISDDDLVTKILQSALDHAENKTIYLGAVSTLKLDGSVTVPDYTRVINQNNTEFQLDFDSGSGGGPIVTFGEACSHNILKFYVPSSGSQERVVQFGSRHRGGITEVKAEDQQSLSDDGNYSAIMHDGADSVVHDILIVQNFDRSISFISSAHCVVNKVLIESYVRGIKFVSSNDCTVNSGSITVRSGNGELDGAGNNGVLIEKCDDIGISYVTVQDSAEHAFRVGGGDPIENSHRISFTDCRAQNAYGCGIKCYTGGDSSIIESLSINNFVAIDVGNGTFSSDAVRLERVRYSTVSGIVCEKKDKSYSAFTGLYITGCTNLLVSGLQLRSVEQYGIHIAQKYGDSYSIRISDFTIMDPGKDGIYVDYDDSTISDLVCQNFWIRGQNEWGINVEIDTLKQVCLFTGCVEDSGNGIITSNKSDDSNFITVLGDDFNRMPKFEGNPVVESGSNDDGSWTRWADGTQICYIRHIDDDSSERTITFPRSFSDSPVVVGNPENDSPRMICIDGKPSNTDVDIIIFDADGNKAKCYAYFQAVGRWD